jgi:NAD(P)-dependent dehydrogenase (short-subunit alcohol dehydrogenase family)
MEKRVALVTGASRGVGRGIAVALGAAGWDVWVTGRSSAATGSTSHLPGTVEATAAAVTAAGGHGVPVRCDHRDDEQTRALVARLESDAGSLNLLVNNVWGGYERLNAGGWAEWTSPFWQQPLELWDAMFDAGVRAHYATTTLCADLLRRTPGSLIVTVSMEVGAAHEAQHGVAYSMAKAADDRLTVATALALRDDAVAAVSLYPGLVRTEGVMQFAEHLDLDGSESPEGVGRVVAGLAADPDVMLLSGRALRVRELADRYGVDTSG